MNTTIRKTQNGFRTFNSNGFQVYINGNPVSISKNQLPNNEGFATNIFTGNNSIPFNFKTVDQATDFVKNSGRFLLPGSLKSYQNIKNFNNAKFFSGNMWLGTFKNGALEMFEKPIGQLL